MITHTVMPGAHDTVEPPKPERPARQMEHRTDILNSLQQAGNIGMMFYIQTIVLLDIRELLWQLAGREGIPGGTPTATATAKPARKTRTRKPAAQ